MAQHYQGQARGMAGPFPYPNVEFDEWLTFNKTVPAVSTYCNSPDDYVPLTRRPYRDSVQRFC